MKNQSFIYPTSNLTVTFTDTFNTVNNLRQWQFSAAFGQLAISQYNNNGIMVSYTYAAFSILNSQISDFNGKTFPSAIFPNITFGPRCF
jgi:hypothetical protein